MAHDTAPPGFVAGFETAAAAHDAAATGPHEGDKAGTQADFFTLPPVDGRPGGAPSGPGAASSPPLSPGEYREKLKSEAKPDPNAKPIAGANGVTVMPEENNVVALSQGFNLGQVEVRRGPGRPPGSRNRSSDEWAEYFLQLHGNPLMWLGKLLDLPTRELALQRGIANKEALLAQLAAAKLALQYVMQKQPLAIQTDAASMPTFYIGLGSPELFAKIQASAAGDRQTFIEVETEGADGQAQDPLEAIAGKIDAAMEAIENAGGPVDQEEGRPQDGG